MVGVIVEIDVCAQVPLFLSQIILDTFHRRHNTPRSPIFFPLFLLFAVLSEPNPGRIAFSLLSIGHMCLDVDDADAGSGSVIVAAARNCLTQKVCGRFKFEVGAPDLVHLLRGCSAVWYFDWGFAY